MKVNRNDIGCYDLQGYIDWLIGLPTDLIIDMSDLELLKMREKDLVLRAWKWHSYFLRTEKKSIHYPKYEKIYADTIKYIRSEIQKREKSEETLRYFALCTNIEDLQQENGVVKFKSNEEYIDLIINSNIRSNVKVAEKLIEVWRNACWETLEEKKFDSKRYEKEISKYEQINFPVMDYLENNTIDARIYLDRNFEVCQELAELLFYKELVTGEKNVEHINKDCLSMNDKLNMLKDIGMFSLPFFSVNPLDKERPSEREQSRFLSKVLECNEDNIRKALKKVR
ncbi:hypothetical protein [Bacteroides sp.]|uniref:hypothetical protein n=1 Tax=Bacteroides sp. TaxID=29523 RepID=UPI0025C55346|nr:hypothetical protein [Bacteroides sp.]